MILNVFIYCIFLYIAGVGVNPGNLLCKTCVRPGCKRYTVGGIRGGDLEIKNIQINSFSLFYFMSKMSKIQYMKCNALNGMHVEDVEDIKNTCILVILTFYTGLWMFK